MFSIATIIAFLYVCHLANLTNTPILKLFSFIDKIVRIMIGSVILLLYVFIMFILGTLKNKITPYALFFENLCFNCSLIMCGKIIPKIFGLRTVYTNEFDKNTPRIIICNHHNLTDGFVLATTEIKAYWIAKSGVNEELPIFGTLLKHVQNNANFIFYKKGDKMSGEQVKQNVLNTIKNKKRSVVVFPEGTTQKCGNDILPFKAGMFHLAYDNDIEIQPISIHYTKQVGFGQKDYANVASFFDIIDMTVVCEPSEVIIKREGELFEDYLKRAQCSLSSYMYQIY